MISEGLTFLNGTTLLESAGEWFKSELHTINILKANETQVTYRDKDFEFGEGCDLIGGFIYQLLWTQRYISLVKNLTKTRFNQFLKIFHQMIKLKKGGDCHIEQKTMKFKFLFQTEQTKYIGLMKISMYFIQHMQKNMYLINYQIYYANGTKAKHLNELEYANGILYANVYLTTFILSIDIDEGKIIKIYDLNSLRLEVFSTPGFEQYQNQVELCLNGIAYYQQNNSFWVTGKYWPYFWEISLE